MPVIVVATPVLTAGNQETIAPAAVPTMAPLRISGPRSDRVVLCCDGITGVERRLRRRVGEPKRPDSRGSSIEGVAMRTSGESSGSSLKAASPKRPQAMKIPAAHAMAFSLPATPGKGPVPLFDMMTRADMAIKIYPILACRGALNALKK